MELGGSVLLERRPKFSSVLPVLKERK